MKKLLFILLILVIIIGAIIVVKNFSGNSQNYHNILRKSKIPATAIKITPQTDVNPPKSFSLEYSDPVPVLGKVNTAGAEDSAFILPDGNTLYFFFTPDVNVPVEKQISDGVTGIWFSKKINGQWQEPERVFLNDPNKADGDGCEFVQGDIMYFCSVREGYTGIHWFSAKFKNGRWQEWKLADFNPDYKVGELDISSDGSELYFHSDRAGGKGGLDIWVSKKTNGRWQEPENVSAVNTSGNDGWPALSPDGNELWITRDYALWRSEKINGQWQTPEKMFGPLAGEATIDNTGNVYFTHHFYKNDKMIEADIYVARKK